jgi:hypothetical protein
MADACSRPEAECEMCYTRVSAHAGANGGSGGSPAVSGLALDMHVTFVELDEL